MKKNLFFLVVFTLFCTPFYAQMIQFGVKAGVNFANFTGGNVEGYDFKTITSYHAGIVSEIKLLENLSIQPELLYSTQGAKLEGLGDQIKNELGYISIPVLAKFYLTSNKLSLELGPQASFLVSERNKVSSNDSKTFDFALAGGLSYKITNSIFIQGRYALGLTEVSKDADVKNSTIQFSLGYMF
ncbi:PorT family protein [Flavobacterium supellecticarium]|uniref:PorT family protein n=1 Tax=Flavobacterium supellecticarium TaxID=2565924 RepID=A0A4S3ZZE9_9FLAO|nr:porin family protein [Flavobacterium supellecticarium]THF51384.1 PorT family protein [Flavobacterium supellecticarium]